MGANKLSDAKKNRVQVDIYGQRYIIVGTESESHIRTVASLVDEKMRAISNRNPSLDTAKLAVLTAVNAVNEYIKLKEKVELLENELKKQRVE